MSNFSSKYDSSVILQTCESIHEDSGEQTDLQIKKQLKALNEMVHLLQLFERQRISKDDLAAARETSTRINQLLDKQDRLKQELISNNKNRDQQQLANEHQHLVKCFEKCWDEFLNQLVTELAHAEKALKEKHSSKMQEIADKFENKKSNGFKPSIELSNIKRKVVGLIKMRSYELAGIQSLKASQLQAQEVKLWKEKVDEQKKHSLDVWRKKHWSQFDVLHRKNQYCLMQKIKQRDIKFDILLKKNHVKQTGASRNHKQMVKSISSTNFTHILQ